MALTDPNDHGEHMDSGINKAFLVGERLYLRPLEERDCEGSYPGWLNNPDVCKGNRHHVYPYTVGDARSFLNESKATATRMVLAIVLQEGDRHIGNVALDNIDLIARNAELTILIGEREVWNCGYGKEAARLLCSHAFQSINLNRISCGTVEDNSGMRRLAEQLGMSEEGRRRMAAYKRGRYLDIVDYGILKDEFCVYPDKRSGE
jgi:ribosomal-protein-alanine N-acetyltransferase